MEHSRCKAFQKENASILVWENKRLHEATSWDESLWLQDPMAPAPAKLAILDGIIGAL